MIPAGTKSGVITDRVFTLRHCQSCRYSCVCDPWLEFDRIYDEAYYSGLGADRLVDYVGELREPQRTVRAHEWRGLIRIVQSLTTVNPATQWLDYGCGNGGLVRYSRRELGCQTVGFEEGWIQEQAAAHGTPLVTAARLKTTEDRFDVVTLIEVIEHTPDPIGLLQDIRRLLRPGGLLFLTTGNARPYRGRLEDWRYVVPEIHISFFEPATLELALRRAGFEPEFPGYLPGSTDVIRFKILKNLGRRRRSAFEALIPWESVARVTDKRFGITAHPVGRA